MTEDVKHMVEKIHRYLIGAEIKIALTTEDDSSFGFRIITKDKRVFDVWVDRDAEANGPGWLNITKNGKA